VPFASFADVAALPADELRALFARGEAQERVWAAWALGQRLDAAFARELAGSARADPHPGVRRHLIVVLAGAGERASIGALAAHDPDPHARATALQYLARLAAPDDHDANELLRRTLATGPALLCEGCIAGLRPDAPPDLWRAVEESAASPDRDLRRAAYEAALARPVTSRPDHELALDFLRQEPDAEPRREAIRRLYQRGGGQAVRRLLESAAFPLTLAEATVDVLGELGVRLPWPVLERFVRRLPASGRRKLLGLLADGSAGAARGGLLALTAEEIFAPSWDLDLPKELERRLLLAFQQNRTPLSPEERELRRALHVHLDRILTAAATNPKRLGLDDDDDYSDQHSWRTPDTRKILAALDELATVR
jgi:hypothetical protein